MHRSLANDSDTQNAEEARDFTLSGEEAVEASHQGLTDRPE